MAQKSLRARKFLPFHEAAAGEPWDAIDNGIQAVIMTLLRLSGLRFLIVGLQLLVVSVVSNWDQDLVVTLALPLLSLLFCVGLCVINYQLHSRTSAQTPWKGSLYVAIVIAVALALSIVQ